MTYKCNILLGRITKVNGYEGAVTVKLENNFIENIPIMESVFLEIEGRPVPFFISVSEYRGADQLKLEFAGYNTINKIVTFVGCRVFLTDLQAKESSEGDIISSLKDYSIVTAEKKLLGSISDVIENPGQLLLSIITPENKSVLIPYHEHFIVSIIKEEKIIVMNLPEGLTEIN